MTTYGGFYSIIQYCPNLDRGEGINIGVVLFCPELRSINVRMTKTNEAVRRHFRGHEFDDRRLSSAKGALACRLRKSEVASIVDFRVFISKESEHLVIVPPKQTLVSRPDIDIDALFDELVGESSNRRRARAKAPDLSRVFEPLTLGAPILRDQTVEIPILGHKLAAPYAYRNGTLNYVKPQGFSAIEDSALQSASHLGVQGHMLHKHPDPDTNIERRLVVVADFEDPRLRPRISQLFEEFMVRLVPYHEVKAFAEEVRKQAHN